MLVNETCWGGCPIMPEHYHYNSTRTGDDPIFFASPISRVSCSTWDVQHPEYDLKQANLPPWKRDWEEMLDLGIDVFKLHGRESAMRLQEVWTSSKDGQTTKSTCSLSIKNIRQNCR